MSKKKIIIIIICAIIIFIVLKNSGNKQSNTEEKATVKDGKVLRKDNFYSDQKDGYAIKKLREDPLNYLTKEEQWYHAKVARLQQLAKGYTNGSEEQEMATIMKEMQTNADVLKCIDIWGTWDGDTLIVRLQDELDHAERDSINKDYVEKNIKYRL